jgi:hypothetical protein
MWQLSRESSGGHAASGLGNQRPRRPTNCDHLLDRIKNAFMRLGNLSDSPAVKSPADPAELGHATTATTQRVADAEVDDPPTLDGRSQCDLPQPPRAKPTLQSVFVHSQGFTIGQLLPFLTPEDLNRLNRTTQRGLLEHFPWENSNLPRAMLEYGRLAAQYDAFAPLAGRLHPSHEILCAQAFAFVDLPPHLRTFERYDALSQGIAAYREFPTKKFPEFLLALTGAFAALSPGLQTPERCQALIDAATHAVTDAEYLHWRARALHTLAKVLGALPQRLAAQRSRGLAQCAADIEECARGNSGCTAAASYIVHELAPAFAELPEALRTENCYIRITATCSPVGGWVAQEAMEVAFSALPAPLRNQHYEAAVDRLGPIDDGHHQPLLGRVELFRALPEPQRTQERYEAIAGLVGKLTGGSLSAALPAQARAFEALPESLRTEQRYEAMASAIRPIADPATRAAALESLSRAFAALAPRLRTAQRYENFANAVNAIKSGEPRAAALHALAAVLAALPVHLRRPEHFRDFVDTVNKCECRDSALRALVTASAAKPAWLGTEHFTACVLGVRPITEPFFRVKYLQSLAAIFREMPLHDRTMENWAHLLHIAGGVDTPELNALALVALCRALERVAASAVLIAACE